MFNFRIRFFIDCTRSHASIFIFMFHSLHLPFCRELPCVLQSVAAAVVSAPLRSLHAALASHASELDSTYGGPELVFASFLIIVAAVVLVACAWRFGWCRALSSAAAGGNKMMRFRRSTAAGVGSGQGNNV
jgi:hypothetical protein